MVTGYLGRDGRARIGEGASLCIEEFQLSFGVAADDELALVEHAVVR